jgi:hypothetical protein
MPAAPRPPDVDASRRLDPLAYRSPGADFRPIDGRSIFRIVRWAGYATLFAAIAGAMLFALLTRRVHASGGSGVSDYLTVGFLVLVFLALTGFSAWMIRSSWRDACRRSRE